MECTEVNEDSFLVSVDEASQLLGVSRTRLSQLTTQGTFSFERRKIDTRNRLFYKRSEIVGYMSGRIQGAVSRLAPHFIQSHPLSQPIGERPADSRTEEDEGSFSHQSPAVGRVVPAKFAALELLEKDEQGLLMESILLKLERLEEERALQAERQDEVVTWFRHTSRLLDEAKLLSRSAKNFIPAKVEKKDYLFRKKPNFKRKMVKS